MALVTVIGATTQSHAVTVEGATYSLKQQYMDRMAGKVHHNPLVTEQFVMPSSYASTVAGGSANPSDWASVKGSSNYITDAQGRTITLGANNPGNGSVSISGVSSATINDNSQGHELLTFNTEDGTVTGGVYDTISAVGNLTVANAANSHITVGGSLTFIGGTARGNEGSPSNNTITAGNATIYAATNGSYVVDATVPGGTTYLLQYQGATGVNFDASSSHQALDAWVGNKDTVHGSSLGDHFRFVATADSLRGGDVDNNWQSTVYGGSGDNLFDFLSTGGGHYTIADFGKSASNKVELHGISQSTLDKDLANSKGSNTLKLDDGTQITFSGMTIGNDITDSDFLLK